MAIVINANINFERYVEGVYISDTDDSGVDVTILYIGKNIGGKINRERLGHIIMSPDIANTGIKFKYRIPVLSIYKHRFVLKIETDDPIGLPDECQCEINIITGTLTIWNDDVLYLKLYKDNNLAQLSDIVSTL